mmetsp:Transcript_119897/g.344465  ORF Transcript_119897/g.344465 Transcript_119897/m.344465 type:complete len:282 (-) Transcript_119897:398-1243(-)
MLDDFLPDACLVVLVRAPRLLGQAVPATLEGDGHVDIHLPLHIGVEDLVHAPQPCVHLCRMCRHHDHAGLFWLVPLNQTERDVEEVQGNRDAEGGPGPEGAFVGEEAPTKESAERQRNAIRFDVACAGFPAGERAGVFRALERAGKEPRGHFFQRGPLRPVVDRAVSLHREPVRAEDRIPETPAGSLQQVRHPADGGGRQQEEQQRERTQPTAQALDVPVERPRLVLQLADVREHSPKGRFGGHLADLLHDRRPAAILALVDGESADEEHIAIFRGVEHEL